MCKKSCCNKTVKILVVIGAISWGLVGLFNFNFVEKFFGGWPFLVITTYIVIGLAGVVDLINLCKGSCKSEGHGARPPDSPRSGGEEMNHAM